MIKRDFSRTFLREGYDMREVLSFLADVERTITGQQEDPKKIVTAQQAEDIEFSVRLRGFNVDEVDMEIDRLIQVLQGLDRQREQAPLNAEQAETAAVPVQAAPRHRWRNLRSPRRLPPLCRCLRYPLVAQVLRVPRCQSVPRWKAQLCRSSTRPLRCLRLTSSSRHRLWRFLMPSRWPCPPSMPISARRRPLMTFFVP